MAKGLYLTSDGQVLVEYDKRRRVPIPSAQYKANGYKPFAVGTSIAGRPPHRSGRARFEHPAPTSGV